MTHTAHSAGRFWFSLALVFLSTLCRPAAAEISENRTVNVGIYENAPKIFTAESGKPTGIFVDIIDHISGIEGWNFPQKLR
jgi:hypothetical protein